MVTMTSEGEIREGFLCPICVLDLGTVVQLQQHFEDAHSSEDKAVLQQLKGLFEKAKKKILGEEEEQLYGAYSSDHGSIAQATVGASFLWEPQEFGVVRSHLDDFKRIRDARIDRYVVETNKLIIRLDKLVCSDAPGDPGKRKVYEREVVPWAPDNRVNLCPSCGKSFHLTRRRHHCRLCGGIMCNKCSHFLPFSYGKKLTNPAFQYDGDTGFLKRTSSSSSLNSMMGAEGEPHIRTCWDCRQLLERRDKVVEQRNTCPMVVQIYDKMKICIDDSDLLQPEFQQMADSLNAGETTHGLPKAHQLRNNIIRLYDTVDMLSKRIANLGLDQEELPCHKQLQMQKFIRIYASQFLHENMLTLQNLPSEDEYNRLKQQRDREIQLRLAMERRAAAVEVRQREERERNHVLQQEQRQPRSHAGTGHNRSGQDSRQATTAINESGWIPYEVSSRKGVVDSTDDPMVQQMNIIRGYIHQARQARKLDEVGMLEENLCELQQEYYHQMRRVNDTASSSSSTVS